MKPPKYVCFYLIIFPSQEGFKTWSANHEQLTFTVLYTSLGKDAMRHEIRAGTVRTMTGEEGVGINS